MKPHFETAFSNLIFKPYFETLFSTSIFKPHLWHFTIIETSFLTPHNYLNLIFDTSQLVKPHYLLLKLLKPHFLHLTIIETSFLTPHNYWTIIFDTSQLLKPHFDTSQLLKPHFWHLRIVETSFWLLKLLKPHFLHLTIIKTSFLTYNSYWNRILKPHFPGRLGLLFIWLDATDLATEGDFISNTTGLPIDYFNWIENAPDNYADSQHCAAMNTNSGKWDDRNCETPHYFFCEYPWKKNTVLYINSVLKYHNL